MYDSATLKKHAALFADMGSAVGLDVQQQAIEGTLPKDEISEAVLRCAKCAHPKKCSGLLSRPEYQPATPSDFCRNRDLLDYLQECDSEPVKWTDKA